MDAEQNSPLDLDDGETAAEEGAAEKRAANPDPDDIQPKERRPWLEDAKSGLRAGLHKALRYGSLGRSYGLRYLRRFGSLALRHGLRWGGPVVLWVAALALSFFVLVRGSMYAYQSMGWGTWSSIALGILATVLVLCAYLAWLWTRITGEGRIRQFVPRAVIALVAAYSMYGLLYMSAGDSRDPELGDYHRSLHPLMKLGASTYFLFDRDGVVTDPERTAEDYLGMGLPMNEASLHFKLGDRYVHAMDLRTAGRSPRRNRFTVAYLRFMGFRSLHHVDATDHLHVSLPLRGP